MEEINKVYVYLRYGEWFAIPYALPKCDLIAVPDFHMGKGGNDEG